MNFFGTSFALRPITGPHVEDGSGDGGLSAGGTGTP